MLVIFFFFQAEDGIRDGHVTGVQTCALPIYGFESDFIAQGKKMKSLRARMHHNGKDAGAGTLEYLGIILFVGLIVVGLVLTATPIGSKIAEKLCEAFGTSDRKSVV